MLFVNPERKLKQTVLKIIRFLYIKDKCSHIGFLNHIKGKHLVGTL